MKFNGVPIQVSNDLTKMDDMYFVVTEPTPVEVLALIVKELERDTTRLLNSNRRGDQSLGNTLSWCRSIAQAAIDRENQGK